MLAETDNDRMAELRHLRELSSANVAGVIIVPTAKPLPESIRLLSEMPHIQLLRNNPLLGDQWFTIDDSNALFQATHHLLELGHERIAYFGGSTKLPTGAARLQGFRAALDSTRAEEQARTDFGSPSGPDVGRSAVRRLLALSPDHSQAHRQEVPAGAYRNRPRSRGGR